MKNMDTEFIKAFESRICDLLPSKRELIHEAIIKCVEDTNAWLNRLPAPISLLNIRRYFVERFSETVPTGEALMTISLKQIDEKQSTEQIIPPDAAEYRAAFTPFPGLRSFAGSVSRLPGRAGEFVMCR